MDGGAATRMDLCDMIGCQDFLILDIENIPGIVSDAAVAQRNAVSSGIDAQAHFVIAAGRDWVRREPFEKTAAQHDTAHLAEGQILQRDVEALPGQMPEQPFDFMAVLVDEQPVPDIRVNMLREKITVISAGFERAVNVGQRLEIQHVPFDQI